VVTQYEQKIINLSWQAAKTFKIEGLTKVIVQAIIYDEGAKTTDHGHCYKDGVIQIRHMHLANNKRPLSPKTIRDTIAHELAHIDEFHHGKSHKQLTSALKVWLERNW
jgi:predicted metal-dependent hydrolase